MTDLALAWGGDLGLSPGQDLMLADRISGTEQRITRRLLTAPGTYIWNTQYGAGLGASVGTPVQPGAIEAVIRAQLALEAAVAAMPAPQVGTVFTPPDVVMVRITYADALSRVPASFGLTVSN